MENVGQLRRTFGRSRRLRLATACACGLFVGAVPAFAATEFAYAPAATRTAAQGGVFTTGWAARNYNKVWRAPGHQICWDAINPGQSEAYTQGCDTDSNPAQYPENGAYLKVGCNVSSGSLYLSCYTTRP